MYILGNEFCDITFIRLHVFYQNLSKKYSWETVENDLSETNRSPMEILEKNFLTEIHKNLNFHGWMLPIFVLII